MFISSFFGKHIQGAACSEGATVQPNPKKEMCGVSARRLSIFNSKC
jgi:hypothetical protein